DLHTTPLPERAFDVAVLSNIMHQESPDSNRALLARLRATLRPGGRLVVSDFVVDDDRSGPMQALLFGLNMLVHTPGGRAYSRGELSRIFQEAGFAAPGFHAAGPFSTLIVAQTPGSTAG